MKEGSCQGFSVSLDADRWNVECRWRMACHGWLGRRSREAVGKGRGRRAVVTVRRLGLVLGAELEHVIRILAGRIGGDGRDGGLHRR